MKQRLTTFQWTLLIVAVAVLSAAALTALDAYVFAGAHVYGPAKGLFNRTFRSPSILRAGFVEDLNADRPEAQLEKFLSVYRSQQGSCGLRRTVPSVEGTPVGKCLVTENGKLTLVIDFTRDRNSTRNFVVLHPSAVSPGPTEAVTNRSAPGPRPIPTYMNCVVYGRLVAF